jgi:hypothetical protein
MCRTEGVSSVRSFDTTLQSTMLLVVIRVPVAVFRNKNSPLTTLFSSLWRLIKLAFDVTTIGVGVVYPWPDRYSPQILQWSFPRCWAPHRPWACPRVAQTSYSLPPVVVFGNPEADSSFWYSCRLQNSFFSLDVCFVRVAVRLSGSLPCCSVVDCLFISLCIDAYRRGLPVNSAWPSMVLAEDVPLFRLCPLAVSTWSHSH